MAIKFQELLEAFQLAGDATEVYVCKASGKIYYVYDDMDEKLDPLPEDIDDDEKYILLPKKHELDLGKRLALRFVDGHLPDDSDEVRDMFRQRGAYSRFKRLLERRHMLDRWYAFEDEAQEQALREWCGDNEVEFEE